jgi:hypothetical protein
LEPRPRHIGCCDGGGELITGLIRWHLAGPFVLD